MIDLRQPLDRLPDPLPIPTPPGPFDATITVPGSKSLTCRAYVLAALAEGTSRIAAPLRAADTDLLLAALGALGAVARWDGADVEIRGVGGRFPHGGSVNLGDGGAPTRFMIAAACLAAGPVVVDGSPRMRQRPVAEGVGLLRAIGARIDYVEGEGRLPVRVHPAAPDGGTIEVPATLSSQFISALLLIAPFLARGIELHSMGAMTSESYVDLTLDTLARFGVRSERSRGEGMVRVPRQLLAGREFAIEPDASSAAFWMTAAAVCAGSRVRLMGVPPYSKQPDWGILMELEAAGAHVRCLADGLEVKNAGRLGCLGDIDASDMPDAAVVLAAAAVLAEGPTTIHGLRTLRVKESDRIAALAAELAKLGCTVQPGADYLAIDPGRRHDRPAVIETWNDHRMAMAFAVVGLARPGLSIANPACVAKSYPGFWSDLARLIDSSLG